MLYRVHLAINEVRTHNFIKNLQFTDKYIYLYIVGFLSLQLLRGACSFSLILMKLLAHHQCFRSHRGRDRMVVALTATYAIRAYHYTRCEFEF
jgi:hypothetical protein